MRRIVFSILESFPLPREGHRSQVVATAHQLTTGRRCSTTCPDRVIEVPRNALPNAPQSRDQSKTYAYARPQTKSPGLQPFTPTRIDWLTTTLQASLRSDELYTEGFLLDITSRDPETVLIYVRYRANVNREAMNISIDVAREVIQTTTKRYGWDSWVKVREDVQLAEK